MMECAIDRQRGLGYPVFLSITSDPYLHKIKDTHTEGSLKLPADEYAPSAAMNKSGYKRITELWLLLNMETEEVRCSNLPSNETAEAAGDANQPYK